MRKIRTLALAALAAANGCADRTLPPRAELVVYVDTDAPLALPPGDPDAPETPAPLFDRLRVEILQPDGSSACDACARDFAVFRGQLGDSGPAFGILAPQGRTDLRVRARLFRGTSGGEPREASTIDRIVTLPALRDDGLVEVTVSLPLEAVGTGPNPPEPPIPARTGRPSPSQLYPGVVPTGCTTPAMAGEVCVPGGAFWMSDPDILTLSLAPDQRRERVVLVAPHWIDTREVTVAELRASGLATLAEPARRIAADGCTYTEQPGETDSLPVTCIEWSTASAFCAAKGGRLPTEAELERLLGGLRSRRHPWGDDEPRCEDAVFARSNPAALGPADAITLAACASLGLGPAAAGAGLRDRLVLGGESIYDLAGNVYEWSADAYQDFGRSCWPTGLLDNPRCTAGNGHTIRGSSWVGSSTLTRSTYRVGASNGARGIGFRCARDGR